MQQADYRLNSCFWELTYRCQLRCLHCRSGSGEPLPNELDLNEALDLADQLVAQKVRFVILTGGEPTLYPGWDRIARRLTEGGVRVRLFTNGYEFDQRLLHTAQAADVSRFTVSLDGPRPWHDDLRPPSDSAAGSSFDRAIATIKLLVETGVDSRVVTQVNRINVNLLDQIYNLLVELGAGRWQLHLCQMTGRAGENRRDLICLPADLEQIVKILLVAAKEKKIIAPMHCTVGYMTSEEPVLRGREVSDRAVWKGCEAGRRTLAIGPDGAVKGCTTLPDEFSTGSIRERPLAEIWADDACFPYTRGWAEELLSGPCRVCTFAKICRAGCPGTAYGATGSMGANPYCLRLVRGS